VLSYQQNHYQNHPKCKNKQFYKKMECDFKKLVS